MIEVDQRMAPGRHQYLSRFAGRFQAVGVEAQLDGLLHRHGFAACDLGKGLGHVGRIAAVQGNIHPIARDAFELRNVGGAAACLDG